MQLVEGRLAGPLVTPEAIGYSKLSLWAMISCPALEVRKATNCCAAAWWLEDLRMPAPETSITYPASCGAKVGDGRVHILLAPTWARSRYQ